MSESRSFEREFAEAYLLLLEIWIWSETGIDDGADGLPASLRKKAIKVLGEDVASGRFGSSAPVHPTSDEPET